MYFHRVYSPEFLANASGGRSTRKLFCQATELMVTKDHEFLRTLHLPPLPSFRTPLMWAYRFLCGVLRHVWVQKPNI